MTALVVAPLVLVVVLAVSGVAKLRDEQWTSEAVTHLGVPAAFARPWMVKALPWGELVLAALVLLPARWSLLGVVPATVLMLAYVVVVVHALRTIAHPTCHCFGRLTEGEVTRLTVARNVLLTLLGVVAVVDAWSGNALVNRLSGATVGDWWWLLAVLVVGVLVVLALRESGTPTGEPGHGDSVHGDAARDDLLDYQRLPIPYGTLTRPDDQVVQLRELVTRQAAMLVFLSRTCSSCSQVAAEMPDYQRRLEGLAVHPVLVHDSPNGELERRFDRALFDPKGETLHMFGHSYPMAVLLGADGLLAGGPVAGHQMIAELVDLIDEQMHAADEEPEPADPASGATQMPPVPGADGGLVLETRHD